MKLKVTVEEIVVEEFDVDVPDDIDPYDYVSAEYHAGKIVLESGECQSRQMSIRNPEDDSFSEWKKF